MVPIFRQEIEDGLGEKLLDMTNESITYCSQIIPSDKFLISDSARVAAKHFMALYPFGMTTAEVNDSDLYFVKSILVSTSWNKNDDVFGTDEVWFARHTPSHKQCNIEHDENKIVGHIVSNFAIDATGNEIDETTPVDELPSFYHILTGSVIYTNCWSKTENIDRAENLIREIEAGERFVSMECIFRGFDFAVVTSQGEQYVVTRDSKTSFLTKYLRSYGGSGEYEGNKIGRYLRNLTFSGKGFVKKPANPDSIIFNKDQLQQFNAKTTNAGVLIKSNKENDEEIKIMADNNSVFETQIAELITERDGLKEELVDLDNKLKANDLILVEVKASVAELDKVRQIVESLQVEKDNLLKEKEALASELTEIKQKQRYEKRVATVITLGPEKAEEFVKKFDNLNDEQFDTLSAVVVTNLNVAHQDSSSNDSELNDDDDIAETVADETVLETTVSDVDLSAASSINDKKEEEFKSLASFIGDILGAEVNNNEISN